MFLHLIFSLKILVLLLDYLETLNYIDSEKISNIGICESGGFLLSAVAIDTRIKAVILLYYEWQSLIQKLKNQRKTC